MNNKNMLILATTVFALSHWRCAVYIDALMVTAMVALVLFIAPCLIRGRNTPCEDRAVDDKFVQKGERSWPR